MESYINKVAIVTGSSSGIGAALSKELARRGCIVIGLARRMDKLQALSDEIKKNAGTSECIFHAMKCDVTDEEQLRETFKKIEINYGIPWILVNNAGVHISKSFFGIILPNLEYEGTSFDDVVNTNAKGTFLATKYALKIMSNHSVTGHILNVNSIAGQYLPSVDTNLPYAGSKHMMRIFAEGIRKMVDANKWNIKISNVSPGMLLTDMTKNIPHLQHRIPEMLSIDDIVKACITILDTPPNVLISELIIMPIHQFAS